MKNLIGFLTTPEDHDPAAQQPSADESMPPVRSLVSVRFGDSGIRPVYYNDRFTLQAGDAVYVSGKLAGELGTVERVTTKFKINASEYERIIARLDRTLHGSYRSCLDKMVSTDAVALPPAQFRSWVMAPVQDDEEEPEIVFGDGYELELASLEDTAEVSPVILERALQYCRERRVCYLSVIDGIGVAYVHGTCWYEVTFRLSDGKVTELYCDCPFPGLCKHALAALLTLRALGKAGAFADTSRCFTAIDKDFFWQTLACSRETITL